MITADDVRIVDKVKARLFECATKSAVEEVFDSFKISDVGARTALLEVCMRVRGSSGAPGKLTEEEFYEETLAFFEDGPWRGMI